MADYFASIFGTEKDKVNCSFYFKIGACRHGDRCSRVHNKPSFSQTILIQNLYVNPQNSAKAQNDGTEVSDDETQRHFDEFFEDIYVELEDKYGPIVEMNVCDNLGDHLLGNVYVKFKSERDAERAVNELNNRWFAGKPVYAELSTVTDFREAGCRQYEIGACTRGGFCNFMHLKQISKSLRRELFGSSTHDSSRRSSRKSHRRSRSRSLQSVSSRSRSRSSSRSRRHHRHRDSRHRSRTPRSRSATPLPELETRSRSRSRSRSRRHRRHRHSRHRSRSPRSRSASPLAPLDPSPSPRPKSRSPPARSTSRSPTRHKSSNSSSRHRSSHHKSARRRR